MIEDNKPVFGVRGVRENFTLSQHIEVNLSLVERSHEPVSCPEKNARL